MLPLSPLRFSTIGKPILRTFEILKNFRFFDNSSGTRAKARAKATARARVTAMARATARARRTRARAKDRARARDGRTDGRSYLFSEMRNPEDLPKTFVAHLTLIRRTDEQVHWMSRSAHLSEFPSAPEHVNPGEFRHTLGLF